jgi:hypothetical protein
LRGGSSAFSCNSIETIAQLFDLTSYARDFAADLVKRSSILGELCTQGITGPLLCLNVSLGCTSAHPQEKQEGGNRRAAQIVHWAVVNTTKVSGLRRENEHVGFAASNFHWPPDTGVILHHS